MAKNQADGIAWKFSGATHVPSLTKNSVLPGAFDLRICTLYCNGRLQNNWKIKKVMQ